MTFLEVTSTLTAILVADFEESPDNFILAPPNYCHQRLRLFYGDHVFNHNIAIGGFL